MIGTERWTTAPDAAAAGRGPARRVRGSEERRPAGAVADAARETARTLRIARGLWRVTRGGPAAVAAAQRDRLAELVSFAAEHSPYYRRRYREHGVDGARATELRRLPPVHKVDLMEHFDEWTTDPAVRRAAVDAFVADPSRAGDLLHGRYAVWTTSGTTGRPGVFVHGTDAVAVYQAVVARLYVSVLSRQMVWRRLRGGRRTAAVFVTGGHFAGAAGLLRAQRRHPRLAAGARRSPSRPRAGRRDCGSPPSPCSSTGTPPRSWRPCRARTRP